LGNAYPRRRPYGVLVTVVAMIFVSVVVATPVQITSSAAHLEVRPQLTQEAPPLPAIAYYAPADVPSGNYRLARRAYVECTLWAAARAALQPEIPELVAVGAIKRCASEAKNLRELAIPSAGEGGSLAIMDDVDHLLREHARAIVVEIREKSAQLQE
jgi:hypothetical protein